MKLLKSIKWSTNILCVLVTVAGAFLLVNPAVPELTICYALGGSLAAVGLFNLLRYFVYKAEESFFRNDFILGAAFVISGALIIIQNEFILPMIGAILGAIVMMFGFIKLQDAIDMNRLGYTGAFVFVVLAVINVAWGVLVLINPFGNEMTFIRVVGAGLMFGGISELFTSISLTIGLNKYMKDKENGEFNINVNEEYPDLFVPIEEANPLLKKPEETVDEVEKPLTELENNENSDQQ